MAGVRKGWVGCKIKRSSSSLLQYKLRAAKVSIKHWAEGQAKDNRSTKRIEAKLAGIDVAAARVGWTEELQENRMKLMIEFWKSIRLEE